MSDRLQVLIIEDSEDDAALILMSMRRLATPFVSRRVESIASLRSALDEQAWDLVLSDFNLPNFTARESLEEVRKRSLEMPFIIVSGAIGEEIAAEMMRSGAHDVVNKNHLVRLVPAIERELRETKVREEKRRVEAERTTLLEELKKAVGMRDEFIAIASHELKTPITSLLLQSHFLRKSLEKFGPSALSAERVTRFVEVSVGQMERLNRLVDEMLSMTRMNSQGMTVQRSRVALNTMVDEVLERLSEAIKTSGSAVTVVATEQVDGNWDPLRMEQVVENLVSNAIKYGDGKPIEIQIRKDDGRAQLIVRDHGIGIATQDQQRIFARFERAVSFVTISGLGLGLYIVSQIVRAHGGEVTVQSELGRGSSFTVQIPRCVDEVPSPQKATA